MDSFQTKSHSIPSQGHSGHTPGGSVEKAHKQGLAKMTSASVWKCTLWICEISWNLATSTFRWGPANKTAVKQRCWGSALCEQAGFLAESLTNDISDLEAHQDDMRNSSGSGLRLTKSWLYNLSLLCNIPSLVLTDQFFVREFSYLHVFTSPDIITIIQWSWEDRLPTALVRNPACRCQVEPDVHQPPARPAVSWNLQTIDTFSLLWLGNFTAHQPSNPPAKLD